MANLIASPAQMALRKRITNTKGKEWQKNQEK